MFRCFSDFVQFVPSYLGHRRSADLASWCRSWVTLCASRLVVPVLVSTWPCRSFSVITSRTCKRIKGSGQGARAVPFQVCFWLHFCFCLRSSGLSRVCPKALGPNRPEAERYDCWPGDRSPSFTCRPQLPSPWQKGHSFGIQGRGPLG